MGTEFAGELHDQVVDPRRAQVAQLCWRRAAVGSVQDKVVRSVDFREGVFPPKETDGEARAISNSANIFHRHVTQAVVVSHNGCGHEVSSAEWNERPIKFPMGGMVITLKPMSFDLESGYLRRETDL